MKKSLRAASAWVLSFSALAAGAAEDDASHCKLDTLHGTMAWSTTSLTATGAVSSGSGQESYDGAGHMKYYEFYSDGVTSSTYSGVAKYTISEDCIATVTYDAENVPWVYLVSAAVDS